MCRHICHTYIIYVPPNLFMLFYIVQLPMLHMQFYLIAMKLYEMCMHAHGYNNLCIYVCIHALIKCSHDFI